MNKLNKLNNLKNINILNKINKIKGKQKIYNIFVQFMVIIMEKIKLKFKKLNQKDNVNKILKIIKKINQKVNLQRKL